MKKLGHKINEKGVMSSFPAKTGEQSFVLLNEIFKPDSSFHGGKGLITLLISGLSSSLINILLLNK